MKTQPKHKQIKTYGKMSLLKQLIKFLTRKGYPSLPLFSFITNLGVDII